MDAAFKFIPNSSARLLVVTTGNQPGDVMHVATALVVNDRTDVLILFDKQDDAAKALIDTFTQAASGNANRVKYCYVPPHIKFTPLYYALLPKGDDVNVNPTKELTRHEWESQEKATKDADTLEMMKDIIQKDETQKGKPLTPIVIKPAWMFLDNLNTLLGPEEYKTTSVVGATYLIAETFERAKKLNATTKWYQSNANTLALKDGSIQKWANALPLSTSSGTPLTSGILLLWSRHTGQNTSTGYNPAGDSDLEGQKQLVKLAHDLNYVVVTIGHDPVKYEGELARGDYHLGDFYLNDPFKGKGRPAQVAFYLALMDRFPGRIIQIGQKTGGMDMAALIGMPTVYIEDYGSPTKPLMEKWVEAIPLYRCAVAHAPPSPLGKAIREAMSPPSFGGDYPDWDEAVRNAARASVLANTTGANLPKNVVKADLVRPFLEAELGKPALQTALKKKSGYNNDDLGKITSEIKLLHYYVLHDKEAVIRIGNEYKYRGEVVEL